MIKIKIFGREPALIISAIGALVTLLVSLNIHGLDAGAGAAIVTFLTAIIIAFTTRPVAPALFTAVVSAGAALFEHQGQRRIAPALAIGRVLLPVGALVPVVFERALDEDGEEWGRRSRHDHSHRTPAQSQLSPR